MIKDTAKIKAWQEYSDNIKKSTPVDLSEKTTDKRARIAALQADPEAWFRYYFPSYASRPDGTLIQPAPFHIAATKRIMANPEWYEVRNWSRELAKSTRTMFEVLYLTLTRRKFNVLLISNSKENAVRLLGPYMANLEKNDRIINDYGPQRNVGSWQESEFITKTGAAFRALGAGESPRGSRNEAIRPDILLVDDIDTDEDCRNSETIRKRWDWIEQALMPTRSVSNPCLVLWCGNIIAADCCVVRASKIADHTDLINIRDADGHSTWPDKNSETMIDRVLSKISYNSYQKEYFNNPITEGSVFKTLNYKPVQDIRDYKCLCCYTDPSYKDSQKNDFKATILAGLWRDEFHVIKAFCFQGSIAQMVENHFEMMAIVGPATCYYLMEEVFMQDMFYTEFSKASKQHGKVIPISGDKREKPEKFSRIEALLEPLNRNGKLYFNEAEKDHPGMKALHQQMLSFAAGSRAHDDGPDALEGAIWTINNKEAIKATGNVKFIPRTRNKEKHF